MRYLAIPCVAALLLLHAIAGLGVWRAAHDPVGSGRIVEARSAALTAHAKLDLQLGLAALADRSQPAEERFAAYQAQLLSGRELLIRSLDVNPAQPDALATLATVDYELAPTDAAALDEARKRVAIAAKLAPRVPRVQAQLGELLLRMGYTEEGLAYLARGVELDASLSERVVRLAAAHGLDANVIREALPHGAPELTALRQAFASDALDEYLHWVETAIDENSITPTRELFWTYGDTALQIDQASRLADRMAAWGPYDETGVEASRTMQRARAALVLGDPQSALVWAQQSQALDTESHRLANFLGDTARAAAQPELAIQAYRHALGLLARRNARPRARAFLYRRIGEAQEDLHRNDLAYDAYTKALELNPDEPYAKKRAVALVLGNGS